MQMLGALMGFLRAEKEEPGLGKEHRAYLGEFFAIRDMTCMACDYEWTALVPVEFETIFEANLGTINDKFHTRKTE